ncbi:MAG: MGH1-like glycoside hydrolase domain-containing protein [Terriglobia bacterium]
MTNLTRRDFLAGVAAAGASSLAGPRDGEFADAQSGAAPLTGARPGASKMAADGLTDYFRGVAPKLLRPAEGVLRHPSISPSLPGKAYSTQLWDWDTYWTARGLFRLAGLTGDKDLHRNVAEHAQGSLLNFFDHQSDAGRIPIMIDVNNADPFGCLRSEAPNPNNQAKPVMGQLALLIADELGEVTWLAPRFAQLLRFYDSWTLGNQTDLGLLVWGDDVAIGDDNDPTTFGRPFFSSANLLLNCLYYQDLRAAAELAHRLNRPGDAQNLAHRADELKASIQKFCWDPRDHFYYTVDVQCVDRRAELIHDIPSGMAMSWKCLPLRIQMFTGFLPMWCGLASNEQANELLHMQYLNSNKFRAAAGIRSLSSEESMYSLARSSNPSNWLGPIWIVVNYFIWKGFKTYGFEEAAADLAHKTIRVLSTDLSTSGSLNEYYDPDTGKPLSHPGFVDWNMLVLEMI